MNIFLNVPNKIYKKVLKSYLIQVLINKDKKYFSENVTTIPRSPLLNNNFKYLKIICRQLVWKSIHTDDQRIKYICITTLLNKTI